MIERTDTVKTIEDFIAMLTVWHKENYHGFNDKFNAAVSGVRPIPEGTDPSVIYDWKDADFDRLCSFFKDWYGWNPDLTTGLEYIQKFSWLYYENPKGLEFVSTDPGNLMTCHFVTVNGYKMDSPRSKELVEMWMKELGAKMDEYIIPPGGYTCFNEFFKRELKNGGRPVYEKDDASVVVSPADAIINMIDDNLSITKPINVKTQKLSVSELLAHSPLSEHFEGGTAVSCILMPDVYHRYHSPVGGTVVESDEDVPGNYFGIRDFPKLINGGNVGYGYDYCVFEQFRRGYMIIQTDKYGYVGMVPVGLNTIASVIFNDPFKKVTRDNPQPIAKGQEVGYFQYGGSLNILLFEKGCFPAVRIPQGQVIGTLNEKADRDKPKLQFSF